MKVLITGAAGFIGSRLVQQVCEQGRLGDVALTGLALCDHRLGDTPPGAIAFEGDLGSPELLDRIASFAPDCVFHLAAVPGGAAEADYALGRRVNLETSLALFETMARRAKPAVFVYASTIAVYGTALPARVTPTTPLHPPLTYGAHKLACELLLADFTRRGRLDARSVRLPGIVARPRVSSGLASAFMSDLLHALRAGERYVCPVSPEATAWWMSATRCAENLLHAAGMELSGADPARAWPLPVLRLSIREVVDTLARVYGAERAHLVDYAPQAALEAVFGRYPPLDDSAARALGLRDDDTPEALVRRALGDAADDRRTTLTETE